MRRLVDDSAALVLPPYIAEQGKQVIDIFLHEAAVISVHLGSEFPYVFHGAEWEVTSDIEVARSWKPVHDCENCRAGLEALILALEEDGEVTVALGQVHYTQYHLPELNVLDPDLEPDAIHVSPN